jgi:hypothetical protein
MRVNRLRCMKMLSLEFEDLLDDDMDKADKANVRTIVGDFKIMDKADVADVSTIVGVKDITSKLKFKMNFSGHKGCVLACKTPSPVALEDIAKSRCFLVGLVTRDKWQNDHGDTSHKEMTGDDWQNDHGNDSQGQETGSSRNRCSRRLGLKAFTRTERTQKFKKNQLRGIWCHDTTKKAQKQYRKNVAKYKSNGNWQSSRHNDMEAVNQLFGANEVEIKQKTLEALRLLRQADHALDKVPEYFNNLTKDV